MKSFFSNDYFQARKSFIAYALQNKASDITSFLHPSKGPLQQDLYMDACSIGDDQPEKIIIVTSATHGVEGFCGSSIQSALCQQLLSNPLPSGLSILFIHAVNPYGFAYLRRTNEDNIDLNRNFMDFTAPLPDNPLYQKMHPTLCPKEWGSNMRQINDLKMLYYLNSYGTEKVKQAITQGQYDFPEGLFYGGQEPSWSAKTFEKILKGWTYPDQKIYLVDIHTGLGEKGDAELIASYTDNHPSYQTCKSLFKDENLTFVDEGNSTSSILSGVIEFGAHHILKQNDVTAFTLEFGTYPPDEALDALRAENWLHHHGQNHGKDYAEIKQNLKEMFSPSDPEWENQVTQKGLDVITHMINTV